MDRSLGPVDRLMDRKLRIAKACEECRLRKIRCDGGEPCQRCQFRDVSCEYRIKARNRMKKSDRLAAAAAAASTPTGTEPGSESSFTSPASAATASLSASTHPTPGSGPSSGTATSAYRPSHQTQHARPQHTRTHLHARAQHAQHTHAQAHARYPDHTRRDPHLDPGSESAVYPPYPNAHLHSNPPGHVSGSASVPANRGLHNPSVAATHRASPSVFLQLYYGPSSNFSLLNSIYHQVEGTQPGQRPAKAKTARKENGSRQSAERDRDSRMESGDGGSEDDDMDDDDDDDDDSGSGSDDENGPERRGVEEIGPGLDLFNNRRLYFGDLAGGSETSFALGGNGSFTDGTSMFVDRTLAERLLERYLHTFWLILPIWSRDRFRERLAHFYDPGFLMAGNDPDTIIVLLALSLGASMLEEELTAQYLYRTAKRWASGLDEMVNVQMVQISLMMSHFASERARPNSSFLLAGTAVRKAVAAGLHKGVLGGGPRSNQSSAQAQEAARQMRVTIWSLYFWETWVCFSLGRPSSFPESEMDVPFPTEEKLLHSVVTLARIMSKSIACIYRRHHDSLLPLWNEANEIRRELRQFAETQREDFMYGVVDDPTSGELGVCQTIVSTLYHHTLILTFRPFLVLRAKLQREDAANARHPPPPAWLDTACEYCLDAARHSIAFLIRACERNDLCRAIRYHGFFIEGASHVLAFDLLQTKDDKKDTDAKDDIRSQIRQKTRQANFPWLQLAIRALEMILPKRPGGMVMPVDIAGNLERMIRSVYPDFRAADMDEYGGVGLGQSIPPASQYLQKLLPLKHQQPRPPSPLAHQPEPPVPQGLPKTLPHQLPLQNQRSNPHMPLFPSQTGIPSQSAPEQNTQTSQSQRAALPNTGHSSLDRLAAAAGFGGPPVGSHGPGPASANGVHSSSSAPNTGASGACLPTSAPTVPQVTASAAPVSVPSPLPPPISLANLPLSNTSMSSSTNTVAPGGDINGLGNFSNALPPLLFPFTPFGGLDEAVGGSPGPHHMHANGHNDHGNHGLAPNQATGDPGAPADLTAADLGWNFDFGTMDMEAFLSIDPSM